SSLEAAPIVYIADPALLHRITAELAGEGDGLAEIAITSELTDVLGARPSALGFWSFPPEPPPFHLDDVPGLAVEFHLAQGTKCARWWKILPSVGSDPDYPDVTPRDAKALREWDAARAAAE